MSCNHGEAVVLGNPELAEQRLVDDIDDVSPRFGRERGGNVDPDEGRIGLRLSRGQVRSDVDRDVFVLEVLLDAFVAAFATEAGLLDSAKRRLRVGDQASVEADHPALERFTDAQRAVEVAGENEGDESVHGVVGVLDRLLLVGEGEQRRDRTEQL